VAPSPWLSGIGLVVVAVAVSAFAFAYRLGPPGPVFFVLTFGLAGMITGLRDGERGTDPLPFLAAFASGLLFSYAVALLPLLVQSGRAAARPLREILPGPWMGPGE